MQAATSAAYPPALSIVSGSSFVCIRCAQMHEGNAYTQKCAEHSATDTWGQLSDSDHPEPQLLPNTVTVAMFRYEQSLAFFSGRH